MTDEPIVVGRASGHDFRDKVDARGDKLVDLNQQVVDQNARIIALMERQTAALETIADAAKAMAGDRMPVKNADGTITIHSGGIGGR